MPTAPRRLPLALVAALAGLLAAPAALAEQQAPTEPAAPAAPPAASADTAVGPEQLLKRLPKVSTVVQKDDQVLWDDGQGHAYRFAPVVFDDKPLIETDIGRLPITRKLIDDNRADALAALPALIARAKEAGLQGPDLTLADSILIGVHLRSATAVVVPEGALKKSTLKPADRADERKAVEDAAAALTKELPRTALDELGRKTVEDVLARAAWGEDHKTDLDEVSPAFARRVTRAGWLTSSKIFGEVQKTQVAGLLDAVNAAERFAPVTLFEGTVDGKSMKLANVINAFGYGGWVLSTPTRCAFSRKQPTPMYHWAMPDLDLVVELAPGSDPAAPPQTPLAARLYHNGQKLASWAKGGAFAADAESWRKVVPARGKAAGKNVVTDFIPPSIVLAGLNGDQLGLITEGGLLEAPKDGSEPEVERFLTQAAQALPDAAHLDLLGEYLFIYVYDSPDSRFPFLIGNKKEKGDIHQTAAQTIGDVTAGMMRGDCDDLAELYQTIAVRQGRTAHVISLPQHAACSWAEKKEDGQWHVFVLQTGPAVEFMDHELPKALEKAYKSFDDSETFDPNGIGLSLRFSGENTRSQWRLSWRIFSEPEYARVMIDVQKDWHFQTYQRGISKMLKLIAGGDDDNANYRELAGLYTYTGQYDLAVDYHRKAIERTPDPASKLYMNIELAQQLIEAQHLDEAKALVTDILDNQIPAVKDKLGMAVVQAGAELAGSLSSKLPELAVRTVHDTMLEAMSRRVERLSEWLEGGEYNKEAWEGSGQFLELRRLTQLFAATGIAALKDAKRDALATDPTLKATAKAVQQWLNSIAFHDVDEPDEAMMRYASAGQYYAAILGQERLTTLLEGAEPPTDGEYEHDKRIGGLAQLTLDLPWIRISVPYWFAQLSEMFDKDHATLDRDLVARIGKHIDEAYDICGKLSIEHPQIDQERHLGLLITALVGKDEKAVRERLRYVKEKDDKRLRDDTAQWIGDCARFLPMDWYKQVLGIWKQELNYKPKYYWIAWRAALNGAPRHALYVAEMAATEFKDDPAFTEEFEFMKKVLEPKLKDSAEAK